MHLHVRTKWLKVYMTNSLTLAATLDLKRSSFAKLGLPEVIVSDIATGFTRNECEQFCKRNYMRHSQDSALSPSVNDLV